MMCCLVAYTVIVPDSQRSLQTDAAPVWTAIFPFGGRPDLWASATVRFGWSKFHGAVNLPAELRELPNQAPEPSLNRRPSEDPDQARADEADRGWIVSEP